MMTRNKNAPTEGGVGANPLNSKNFLSKKDDNKTFPKLQLDAVSLRRFRDELLQQPCDRHVSALVDCCDFILDAVEGGNHD